MKRGGASNAVRARGVCGTIAPMVPRLASRLTPAVAMMALVTALPAAVRAEASAPEEKFLEAVQAHKSGDLPKAIATLQDAAKTDPHPTLFFNVGVLADAAGDAKTAAAYYKKYLDTDPEDAHVVLLRYRQIAPKEADAWANAKEANEQAKESPMEEAGIASKEGNVNKKRKKRRKGKKGKKEKSGADAGGGSNLATYGLLGAGGLALAVGAVFGALTVSDVNAFMDSRVRSEAQRHADAAQGHQLVANVSFIAGLAALGGGIAMLLLQDPGEDASAGPWLLPQVGPTAGGGV